MRDAMTELGGDSRKVNLLIPAELVIDLSGIDDVFARPDAFAINAELEFERNQERYRLLRWAQQSFDDFLVVPPERASAIRSTSSTSRVSSSPATARQASRPIPTPWSAPTPTHRWSTAWVCSVGESVGSRPREPCSDSP